MTGQHSYHEISNDNGLRMVSFAAAQGLVIGSTLFPSKRIRKITHVAPDKTISQIDHVLISARHIDLTLWMSDPLGEPMLIQIIIWL